MTIVEFLLARIAEDEAAARPFVNSQGDARPWVAAVGGYVGNGPDPLGGAGEIATATTHLAAVHIARHDPARALAECAAKRAIVAWDAEQYVGYSPVAHLAAVYADHPDYRDEWADTPS